MSIPSLLILNQVSGVNAKSIQEMLCYFGSLDAIVSPCALQEIAARSSFGARFAKKIRFLQESFNVHRELAAIKKYDVEILSFEDPGYPKLLCEISDPPLLLYKRGTFDLNAQPCLSIVGSRNASLYGRDTTGKFSRSIGTHGITVVSGLARGIDACAHMGVLQGGGKTVAVLGCGVDIIYPRSNYKIFENILVHGAIISEYPMGMRPAPYMFPLRNRIIAGMSQGVLVVEASKRSGSLITSRLALEEGRDVYSVPGKIDHCGAQGSNKLLRDGAKMVTCVDDILEDFSCVKYGEGKNDAVGTCQCGEELTSQEKNALSCIRQGGITMEGLIQVIADEPVSVLRSLLTRLEVKGLIFKTHDGRFKRRKNV